jgi:hypothetical protein
VIAETVRPARPAPPTAKPMVRCGEGELVVDFGGSSACGAGAGSGPASTAALPPGASASGGMESDSAALSLSITTSNEAPRRPGARASTTCLPGSSGSG